MMVGEESLKTNGATLRLRTLSFTHVLLWEESPWLHRIDVRPLASSQLCYLHAQTAATPAGKQAGRNASRTSILRWGTTRKLASASMNSSMLLGQVRFGEGTVQFLRKGATPLDLRKPITSINDYV